MAVEEDLVAFLEANVAAVAAGRVWPARLPQGSTLPGIVYQRIDTPRRHTHTGPSGLAWPRFQLSCWGRTLAEAAAVADQLRLALDGYQGDMGGTYVCGVQLVNAVDDEDEETGNWRRIVDAIVWHREPTS